MEDTSCADGVPDPSHDALLDRTHAPHTEAPTHPRADVLVRHRRKSCESIVIVHGHLHSFHVKQ